MKKIFCDHCKFEITYSRKYKLFTEDYYEFDDFNKTSFSIDVCSIKCLYCYFKKYHGIKTLISWLEENEKNNK
jgi:DNA repair photolyase